MIRAASVTAFALALLVCTGARAAEDCASRDPGSAPLMGLTATAMHVFPPGLGTRVGYEGPGEVLSYFRFNLGLARITDADDAQARASATADIGTKAEAYAMTAGAPVELKPITSGGVAFVVLAIRMRNDAAIALEYLAHGHDGRCFHKVRYTVLIPALGAGPEQLATADSHFRDVLEALAPLIAD